MVSFHPYVDKNGEIPNPKNYEYAFAVSTKENCGLMKPYAVFSYAKKELYLDNDGDGKIDGKYYLPSVEAGEKIIKYIKPNCSVIEAKKISV